MWYTWKKQTNNTPSQPTPNLNQHQSLDECTKTFPGPHSPRQQQQHPGLQANINYTCPNLQQKGSHARGGISAIHYAARHLHTCSWPLSFLCEKWARKGAALTHGQGEAATDCKAVRVICTAAPPHTCTALPSSFCSSSSLTETHKHHNFCKDNFKGVTESISRYIRKDWVQALQCRMTC